VARGIRGLIRWWSDSWSTRWSTTRSRRCATAPGYVGRCRIWKPSPCMERLADLAALRCDRGLRCLVSPACRVDVPTGAVCSLPGERLVAVPRAGRSRWRGSGAGRIAWGWPGVWSTRTAVALAFGRATTGSGAQSAHVRPPRSGPTATRHGAVQRGLVRRAVRDGSALGSSRSGRGRCSSRTSCGIQAAGLRAPRAGGTNGPGGS